VLLECNSLASYTPLCVWFSGDFKGFRFGDRMAHGAMLVSAWRFLPCGRNRVHLFAIWQMVSPVLRQCRAVARATMQSVRPLKSLSYHRKITCLPRSFPWCSRRCNLRQQAFGPEVDRRSVLVESVFPLLIGPEIVRHARPVMVR
jgi:hypothetical protein